MINVKLFFGYIDAMNRFSSGFTLIELLVALSIVGILTLMAQPSYQRFMATYHRHQVEAELYLIRDWVEQYDLDHEKWPSSIEQLSQDPPEITGVRFVLHHSQMDDDSLDIEAEMTSSAFLPQSCRVLRLSVIQPNHHLVCQT